MRIENDIGNERSKYLHQLLSHVHLVCFSLQALDNINGKLIDTVDFFTSNPV